MGITSISVRTINEDRRIPQPQVLIEHLMRKAGCYDMLACAKLTMKVNEPETWNGSEREFLKWCATDAAPVQIRTLDNRWYTLFHWVGWAVAGRLERLPKPDPEVDRVFPYRQLNSYGCRLPSHVAIHGLIAKRVDLIWGTIWPPNGWLCSCTVLSLLDFDVSNKVEANKLGADRVDVKLLKSCYQWPHGSLREAWKLLEK